jgi:hypothetical protein
MIMGILRKLGAEKLLAKSGLKDEKTEIRLNLSGSLFS